MKRILRFLGVAVVAASSFVALAPVAGAQVQPAPVVAEQHRVHCEDIVAARSRRHHQHGHEHDGDDECGPPPMVPEVPITVMLPLTAAALAGITIGVRRRQAARTSSMVTTR